MTEHIPVHASPQVAVSAQKLSKRFNADGLAVQDVDLTIMPGSIHGLVGTNGAGKTTLLHMLVGLLKPSAGAVSILGSDATNEAGEYLQRVGFIPDQAYFPTGFTVSEVLTYHSLIYRHWNRKRANQLLQAFTLPQNRSVRQLSKGMKVQLAFVVALSIRPHLLVLDEPTSGLDPVVKRQILQLIVQEAAEGTAVLMATHHMEELEQIADHISLMHQGRIVASSSIEQLKTNVRRIQIVFAHGLPDEVRGLPGILSMAQAGHVYTFVVEGPIDDWIARCNSFRPTLLEELPIGLEDVFVHLMHREGYTREQIALF